MGSAMNTTDILQRVSATDNLPALPAAAIEVLQLAKRSDASVEDLAEVIQNDPALAAKVLKVVNSPMFGLSREISSIQQAVGLLGLRAVTVLALSFALVDTVDTSEQDGFDYKAFWRHSLTTGVTGRLFGKKIAPRLAEEAFVAGLLSKVGMVSAWKGAPDIYRPVLDTARANCQPLIDVETEKLGFTHARMTASLLRAWGLPTVICDAIEAHRGEFDPESDEGRQLTRVVNCAARLSDLFCQEASSAQLEMVCEQITAELGIDQAQLDEVLEMIEDSVRTTAASLAVQVGSLTNYEELKAEATQQIAQLSLEADAERRQAAQRQAAAQAETQRLHEEHDRIQKVAATDGLTGLANRGAFDDLLADMLQSNAASGTAIGLIMIDIDHFKKFNDTFGHRAGDEVLKIVAACLSEQIGTHGTVARYGGEEFGALLPDCRLEAARDMAEAMRQAIARLRINWEGKRLQVRASFGVCVAEERIADLTAETLIEQADQQLYQAKRTGRNRVESTPLNATVTS